MNIFVLHKDPRIAASMMCDKHVVKMIVETNQLLSAVLDLNYKPELITEKDEKGYHVSKQLGLASYPIAHRKHGCTLWAAEARDNYRWLLRHLQWMCYEYYKRYGKIHSLENRLMIYRGQEQHLNFKRKTMTPFYQGMPDDVKDKDVVKAYRDYYNKYKFTFAKWKDYNIPFWYNPPQYTVQLEAA